ncbi:hypothetical protein T440DRAFT_455428 [Plenodomus tracheiphilus IPT5]|uniref:Uncharacterized protein n=1 Tax=Plenodomus tracheiphilus IPT5 TaxID=1408161 RepID=A0A6A7B0W0_9PLEO|nr:hypothetical protein T440DRAFT_455428 [Plenodomus tracheiphilus IPT5]
MRPSGASLLPLSACFICCAAFRGPFDCQGSSQDAQACTQPVDGIVAIVPGVSYIASIECADCPYVKPSWTSDHEPLRTDQVLVSPCVRRRVQLLNVTLAADNRTVLLNDKPIYPLPTIPTPPEFWVAQRPGDLSNANLTSGLACANPYCQGYDIDSGCEQWCSHLRLSSVQVDYLYTAKPHHRDHADKGEISQHWDVTIDLIGGKAGTWFPHWKFENASQKSLRLLIKGTGSIRGSTRVSKNGGSTSDLFGAGSEDDDAYKYTIMDLALESRTYKFSAKKPLGVWHTIKRFLGADVWEEEGQRFLYLDEEWGEYGKKGTLRNSFGHFIHWDQWFLFWCIVSSIIAAIVVIAGGYKLFFWVQQQKRLMSWDGMEDVWDRLRTEDPAEEEATLLPDGYRDEPDAGSSSASFRYTDEPPSMKPLPSKPLPEKPLPSVPLIDT